ncbi:MAG: hypothetical protein GXP15_16645 [Gammaproteobacteria bacterium]|nr:hypothetical protein [Gammaproteobacteria bacterium]
MDRALKERIIGATVLVILAVLIVPVFLDGPSTDTGMTRERVALPGQSEQNTRQQTIVLTRDRTEPVPQASRPKVQAEPPPKAVKEPSVPAPNRAVATNKPAASKPTATRTEVASSNKAPDKSPTKPPIKSPAESATGMWAVQMGSFSNKANAERLATDLRKEGFAAFLSQLKTSSGELHRVRIGPQKDRNSAESIAMQLNRAGHKGQVVPHP